MTASPNSKLGEPLIPDRPVTNLLPVNASSAAETLDQAALYTSAVIAILACVLVGWLWWYGSCAAGETDI